jgi:Tol biopolymer transport system component
MAGAYSAGDPLGPFEILSLLGKGGMGEVYRAHDPRLERDVAIKIAPQRLDERFQREARAIAALNHPNICQIYDIGPDYIVMELVEGSSPAGPFPTDEALRIAGQIAGALAAAHEKGIVHRDLKPDNIKITPAGVVKVLDFGLAKIFHESSPDGSTITADVTSPGAVIGTPAYMAPEQVQGKPADKRADVWAFGVVLFELLTGQRPFKRESVQATLAAVLSTEPDIENTPARVRRLLHACLAKDPAERLSSIGDWRLLLDSDQAGPRPRPSGVRWVSWAIVAVGIVFGAFGLFRFRSAPPLPGVIRFSVPIPGGVAADAVIALSPDGRNLAISATEEGRIRLRVRRLDELEPRLLPGADGARFPFWSPDGRQIGFFADGKLKTILATGGEPATVADVDATIMGGTWGRGGVIVVSMLRQLFKVSDKGGPPVLLYKADSGILFNPSFLPDGRHFLYLHNSNGIYVGSIDGAPAAHLLPDVSTAVYSPDGYLLFARQSRLTAQPFDVKTLTLKGEAAPVTRESVVNELIAPVLSAGQNGALVYEPQSPEQLLWVNRSGAPLEKVASAQGWRSFRLSPDQTRVAFDSSPTLGAESSFDVAILDIHRGTTERLTSEGKGALVPVFAPNGKQIAFTSNRTGRFNPFITGALNKERLVRDMGLKGGFPVDWSPDGKNLLWWGDEDLWVVPLDGGKPDTIGKSRFEEDAGVFSPDGHWIAYSSSVSGRSEIYLTQFPESGQRYTVSSQGGAGPAWRRDGKELFFVAGDGQLTAVPVILRSGDVEFGRAESLFPVKKSYFGRAYEPSLDGQRFLVTAPATAGGASVTVLLNWTQGLGK